MKLDRNELIPYMREVQKGNDDICFNILGIENDRVEFQVCVEERKKGSKNFVKTTKSKKELEKQGLELVAKFIGKEACWYGVVETLNTENFWNLEYFIIEGKDVYYVYANPDTDLIKYSDRYNKEGEVIKRFMHKNPAHIFSYIKNALSTDPTVKFSVEHYNDCYTAYIRKGSSYDEEQFKEKLHKVLTEYMDAKIELLQLQIDQLKAKNIEHWMEKIKMAQEQPQSEFPKIGDEYWYVHTSLVPCANKYEAHLLDEQRLRTGNLCKTYEECKEVCDKIKSIFRDFLIK